MYQQLSNCSLWLCLVVSLMYLMGHVCDHLQPLICLLPEGAVRLNLARLSEKWWDRNRCPEEYFLRVLLQRLDMTESIRKSWIERGPLEKTIALGGRLTLHPPEPEHQATNCPHWPEFGRQWLLRMARPGSRRRRRTSQRPVTTQTPPRRPGT